MRKWLFLNYTLFGLCVYLSAAAGIRAASFGMGVFLILPIVYSGKAVYQKIKKPSLKGKGP
jgi:hypothetical protein